MHNEFSSRLVATVPPYRENENSSSRIAAVRRPVVDGAERDTRHKSVSRFLQLCDSPNTGRQAATALEALRELSYWRFN
jgi:hypothetical protein